jgi:hypothetical protein
LLIKFSEDKPEEKSLKVRGPIVRFRALIRRHCLRNFPPEKFRQMPATNARSMNNFKERFDVLA